MSALWQLPRPLDVISVVIVHCVIWLFKLLIVRPTRNTLALGPGWAVAYWLAVWLSFALGQWGSAAIHQVRRGNDFIEFAPQRSAWAGRVVDLIRFQVAAEAWVAGSATVVGYGSFVVLMVVGVAGEWLVVLFGAWLLRRALAARARRRGPWWQQRSDLLEGS